MKTSLIVALAVLGAFNLSHAQSGAGATSPPSTLPSTSAPGANTSSGLGGTSINTNSSAPYQTAPGTTNTQTSPSLLQGQNEIQRQQDSIRQNQDRARQDLQLRQQQLQQPQQPQQQSAPVSR